VALALSLGPQPSSKWTTNRAMKSALVGLWLKSKEVRQKLQLAHHFIFAGFNFATKTQSTQRPNTDLGADSIAQSPKTC